MLKIFSEFIFCFLISVVFNLGRDHTKFHLVLANKVDLNQIEVNGHFETESGKTGKPYSSDEHKNDLINYIDIIHHNTHYNSSISLGDEEYNSVSNVENRKIANRQFYVDSNGSLSSLTYGLEAKAPDNKTANDLSYYPTEYVNNDQGISEHFDLQHGNKPNITSVQKDKNNNNYSNISDTNVAYGTHQIIYNSFNAFAVDFSVIYDDLMLEPNLKSNVEYTIFNVSNIETKNRIEKELKYANGDRSVINLEDLSSYGFATWIKPLESNSTKVLLQTNSGIMSNEKIRMLKKLFPRRNFTTDELDIFILSELRNEIRPYGYRGSPIILTQYIDNIDLNLENEDIFALKETVETINRTGYFNNSNDSFSIFENGVKDNAFMYWNNSFLLQNDPELLSISCNFYGDWSAWSTCTNECGWGVQTRGRRINANLINKSLYSADIELSKVLMKCKAQIQTQGCLSKAGCCEYQLPMENLWKNCTATCDSFGTEEQIVELISNKKGEVKDSNCQHRKTLRRKCIRLSGNLCKTCRTTDWSMWSNCVNENGDLIQKRTRELTENCNYGLAKLEEKRICEKLPLFSTSPFDIDGINKTNKFLVSYGDPNTKITNEIRECKLNKSEMKYNLSEGSCECPSGINLCDNTVIENDKASWESHLDEICNKETDVFSSKSLMIMAKGKRLYNCKTKSWDRYIKTPNNSDCKNAFVLCKAESKCIVSDWSDWSGCSAPCKSSYLSPSNPPFLSTRFKTRKVISGECNEHSLFKKEECLDLAECPLTHYVLPINITSTEFINMVYSEYIKDHLKQVFTELQSYKVPDNSTSSIMKSLFNSIRNIIVRNSEYIYGIDFRFNVFGGDGNYHSQKFMNFILTKYRFDNTKLVKDIIISILLPSGESINELYNQLSDYDKQIIGQDKDETDQFLREIIQSNHLDTNYQIKETSSNKTVDLLTKDLIRPINSNLKISDDYFFKNSKSRKYIQIGSATSMEYYKNESLDSTKIGSQIENSQKNAYDMYLEIEGDIISKVINPEILYQLINILAMKNTNCRPTEIYRKNVNNTDTKTLCKCPPGYTLCSSTDYYFGNHISSTHYDTEIEIRKPEGVFSDNFVLNQGGLFEQVYGHDKEKYCSMPGAFVMCSSDYELLNAINRYEIRDLYSRFVRFQSSEETN
ncbi:hypothetical protein OJ252_321 [Cryptosporidium canis]|uniref:Thrombospondin type 1 domain-containing protein n=1 Tax=Cryptosporidium canis TaxID=195482 RepID=A0ABQ8PBA5_9CRYT|nr:hypothetical protein OJ252_321 [Cryptosporidium canis]